MKIKVTIEELEPKHISLVASLITELHRAGIEVDVPEEQEDTQETQEDHAEKIRKAEVATKEDVENWTAYARKHLQGSELLEATQSILGKRKEAQQLEEQNIEERNKKQKTLLRNFARMGDGRASSRPDEAPTRKLERLVPGAAREHHRAHRSRTGVDARSLRRLCADGLQPSTHRDRCEEPGRESPRGRNLRGDALVVSILCEHTSTSSPSVTSCVAGPNITATTSKSSRERGNSPFPLTTAP